MERAMSDLPDLPEPLRTVLRIDCHANNFLLDDLIATCRSGANPAYFAALERQLADPALIERIADARTFEALTGIGFERDASVRIWLDRLHRHLFGDGPYPDANDLE